MDASVGLAQSFDDLQRIQKLMGAFNPQQLFPAEAIARLTKRKQEVSANASSPRGHRFQTLTVSSEMFWKAWSILGHVGRSISSSQTRRDRFSAWR